MTITSETIAYAALAFVGFAIGAKLPDVDLAPVFPLRHRSFWTHGPFLPTLLTLAAGLSWWSWWVVAGMLPAVFVHFLLDCFPKHWRGSATIKLYPISYSLSSLTSFLWLALGAVTSGYLWWALVGDAILKAIA